MKHALSTKRCPRCQEEKSTDLFPRNRRMRGGLATYCKPCARWYQDESVRKRKEGHVRLPKVMAGQKYGRLTAIRRIPNHNEKMFWLFHCECGRDYECRISHVRGGLIQSCGCRQREVLLARITKHGWTGTPEYRAWQGMITRCENPHDLGYRNYGGRGIQVCDEWRKSFEEFIAHIGPRPSKDHSMDRIDNDRGYEPGNVKWATRREQMANRRTTVFVEWGGKKMPITEACRLSGVKYRTAHMRVSAGWSTERVFGRFTEKAA